MANKKQLLAVLILLLVFSIIGCGKKSSQTSSQENVRVGTQGIMMNVLPNNPPDKLHAEVPPIPNQFDVILELRNAGAYPQPEDVSVIGGSGGPIGKVYISGYDPYIIKLEPKEPKAGQSETGADLNKMALDGKSTISPNGGQDILGFQGTIDYCKLNGELYSVVFLATACYQYETVVGPTVCIDPDPFTTVNQKKVCQAQGVALTSQGAPIAITRVDEEAFAAKTQFKITVKNVGGGDIVLRESLSKCDPYVKGTIQNTQKVEREDLDKIHVDSVKLADREITCGPYSDGKVKTKDGGLLRLINGEGFIICEISKFNAGEYSSTTSAYTTPMVIHLSYGYRTSIQRNLQIIKEKNDINPCSGTTSSPASPVAPIRPPSDPNILVA